MAFQPTQAVTNEINTGLDHAALFAAFETMESTPLRTAPRTPALDEEDEFEDDPVVDDDLEDDDDLEEEEEDEDE